MITPITDIRYRDFEGLRPTGLVAAYACEDVAPGRVANWVVRIVTIERYNNAPIIEFYSAETNQFVSSYEVDTFMGRDRWGNGYGSGICLQGDVPAWTLSAYDADQIRDWVANSGF